jgi:CRP/FNR family transcriptional regulator, cyclic AMP receptor protein
MAASLLLDCDIADEGPARCCIDKSVVGSSLSRRDASMHLNLEPLEKGELVKESEKALVEKLRQVPLFSGLKEKQLKSILASGKQMSYPEGRVIVGEGEIGVGFYLILDGSVEVKRKGKVMAKLASGNFFGEMSLLDRNARSSDVVASSATTCLMLSSWDFQGLVESHNEIAVNLLKTLVHRLRESNKALSD